jgi:hypothetical protein
MIMPERAGLSGPFGAGATLPMSHFLGGGGASLVVSGATSELLERRRPHGVSTERCAGSHNTATSGGRALSG